MMLEDYLSLVVDDKYNVGSVLGMYGQQLSRGDMLFIEYVLGNNQQYKNIVELGTASGLTSLYLGTAMKLRNGTLTTFDIKDNRTDEVKKAWLNNMNQTIEDILNVHSVMVGFNLQMNNTLAFIDNGDKVKEVNRYAKYLKVGSGFIVHDWETEVFEEQITKTLTDYNFKRKCQIMGDVLCSNCAYFVRYE